MNKYDFYEPKELVKLGILFTSKREAHAFASHLCEEFEIAVGSQISDLLSQEKLRVLDQITDDEVLKMFLEMNCPSYRNIVKKIANKYYEKLKITRLSIPNTVSLVNGNLHKIPIDMLFLSKKTTHLLKSIGYKNIADILQRFNSPHLDSLQEEEGKEIFEMAVMLRYYRKEDKMQAVYEYINSSNSHREDDKHPSSDREETSIDALNLHGGITKVLSKAGVTTVEKLIHMNDKDLLHIRHMNKVKLKVTREALKKYIEKQWNPYTDKDTDIDDIFIENRSNPTDKFLEYAHKESAHKNSMDMLEELIGLHQVKKQVQKVVAYGMMKKSAPPEIKDKLSMVLNMAFVGNPGTAKTTVARILAGIFYENGLLPSNELVEVGRADLVAEYIGQTAIKVQELFERARGKLLFIDEAYALVEDDGYSDEAISTIVQEMENRREDTIVIFAGYPDKMKAFLSKNPGLKSRIPFCIEFQDYSKDELLKITELEATRRGFSITDNAKKKLLSLLEASNTEPDGGNGRLCRNIVESAVLNYAYRNFGDNNATPINNDFVLIPEDFGNFSNLENNKKDSFNTVKTSEMNHVTKTSDAFADYLESWESIWAATRKLS